MTGDMIRSSIRQRLPDVATAVGLAAALVASGMLLKSKEDASCASTERWRYSDVSLAADAAVCTDVGDDYDGAEAHIDAIGDPAIHAAAEHAVDLQEGADSIYAAQYDNDYDEAGELLGYVEDAAILDAVKQAIMFARTAKVDSPGAAMWQDMSDAAADARKDLVLAAELSRASAVG